MPRLLSLNSYHYRRGGSDVVFLEHDELFREAGWETAMFSMRHPNNLPSPWSEYFVDELEFGNEYGIGQKALMATKVVYSFEAIRKLKKLLERFDADVAHAHCIYHHLSPSVLRELRRRSIPVVLTAHDLKLACPAYKMLNRSGVCERCKGGNLTHLVLHRCVRDSLVVSSVVLVESYIHRALGLWRRNVDRIIAPSRFFAAKLKEWGWSDKSIVYIPNFVRSDRYDVSSDSGGYFLYAGRLAPEKGVGTLIRAAKASGVDVCIAGSGPIEGELRALAGSLGNIRFVGYQTAEKLKALVRGARAIVVPSEWYENAPVGVLEAYAAGKPVLAAEIGGIPELVVPGETGFLFSSGNAVELSEALMKLARLPDQVLRDMGHAARVLVEAHFNERLYVDRVSGVYASLGVRPPGSA
jgi:glycosyltransferase involved in cell wall biosynthesis